MVAYVGNDHVVHLVGARTTVLSTGEPQYLNAGATVTFRIQTLAGVDLVGEAWPVVMSYIAGSDGDFLGVLRNEVVVAAGELYRFVATVDNGTDQHGAWDIPLRVLRRSAL